ncbi:MAG: ATP-binding protein [Leeuwenhoekiella sp.]
MKTQTKIIVLLSAIFLSYTAVFSAFIYYSISSYAYNDFYKRLEIRAITTATIELENAQDINAVKEIRQEYLEKLPDEKIVFIELSSFDYESQKEQVGVPLSFINEIAEKKRAFYRNNNSYYSGIRYNALNKDYLVIVSANNYYSTHHIVYLRNLLIVAVLLSILLIGFISYLFSRRVMLPIKEMIDEMQNIGTENLNFRLKEPNNNDELKSLASTFNNMLTRLETSFEIQKNFIGNASHELNTPLTSIIGEAEVALSQKRGSQEYIDTLIAILEEAEKLNQKTKALLFLARSGYNGKNQKFELLRIDELLIDVKNTVERIYPNNQIQLKFRELPEDPDRLQIYGNEQLLHLAISNVLLNACKYSTRDKVTLALSVTGDRVFITIIDQGIGIPESELQFIFDPFFRASNTSNHEGYGVGLSLTRNVLQMHNGDISITSLQDEETNVKIILPLKTR